MRRMWSQLILFQYYYIADLGYTALLFFLWGIRFLLEENDFSYLQQKLGS